MQDRKATSQSGENGRQDRGKDPDTDSGRQQQTRSQYQVRQVTNYQASWAETEPGEEGKFTLQLILDNGVEEYILDTDSDDLEVMLKLLRKSSYTTFDLKRKVLMFSNIDAK
ncbi:MAG: hypothetical protein K2Q28_08615 [Hyphomicrobium sp.]|nr:hypothetical protein [Hyphomicrobium sp.]